MAATVGYQPTTFLALSRCFWPCRGVTLLARASQLIAALAPGEQRERLVLPGVARLSLRFPSFGHEQQLAYGPQASFVKRKTFLGTSG